MGKTESYRLENKGMWKMKIEMPYFGNLSVNRYKIVGRGGRPTNATKPEVLNWMSDLADSIREHTNFSEFYGMPVLIKLTGFFYDDRATPDLSNLHKVIGDAVEPALGVNDREFKFLDEGYTTGCSNPHLIIELEVI